MRKFRLEDLESIISEFEAGDLTTLEVRLGECQLFLARHRDARPSWSDVGLPPPSPPTIEPDPGLVEAAAAVEFPDAKSIDIPSGHAVVAAPSMGTFYRAEKPGAPPFVEVGSLVTEDTQLCLIEVMKLFSTVRAGVQGRIVRILVDDATMIRLGQPLFLIDTHN